MFDHHPNQEIESLETDLRNLLTKTRQQAEETKIAYQAAQSRGNVLKQLLKERDSGRLKNIHVSNVHLIK